MDFSEALLECKAGKKISNSHWPSGMYVVLQEGYPDGIPINGNTAQATGLPKGTVARFRPYLMLRAVDGAFVPYVATQSDLLSEVWGIEGDLGRCTCGDPMAIDIRHYTDKPCHLI